MLSELHGHGVWVENNKCELKIGKVATAWKRCLHWLLCDVVLPFLECWLIAYCLCLNFLRRELLLSTIPVKCTFPGFANASLWFTSTEGEDLTTCRAAGRLRVDTQAGIGKGRVAGDLVTRGKVKIFLKIYFCLALTVKPYNIECWNSLCINVSTEIV